MNSNCDSNKKKELSIEMVMPENVESVPTFVYRPAFNYWARMVSKRPMATVLLGADDENDDNEFSMRCDEPSTMLHGASAPSLVQINVSPLHDADSVHAADFINSGSSANLPQSEVTAATATGNVNAALDIQSHIEEQSISQNIQVIESASIAMAQSANAIAAVDDIQSAENPMENAAAANVSPTADARPPNTSSISMLNIFDLTNVGLSATLAIGVFLVVGHVIRHMTGAAAILSIIIAAACSFLAGTKCLIVYICVCSIECGAA